MGGVQLTILLMVTYPSVAQAWGSQLHHNLIGLNMSHFSLISKHYSLLAGNSAII